MTGVRELMIRAWEDEISSGGRGRQHREAPRSSPLDAGTRHVDARVRDLARLMDEAPPAHFFDRDMVLRCEDVPNLSARWAGTTREGFKRGLPSTLTKDEYGLLLSVGLCFCCGCRLLSRSSALDRKDPRGGYAAGNVVPACGNCNVAKQSHSFATWKRIADAYVKEHGVGTMWPAASLRADRAARAARKALGREAKDALSIVRGIRAFAAWATEAASGSGSARRSWGTMVARHSRDVHPEWRDQSHGYRSFVREVGERPSPKHEIERIDRSRGYVPGNVRWATAAESRRRRNGNLTQDKIREALRLSGDGVGVSQIARSIGSSASTVSGILRGKVARDITGIAVDNGPRRNVGSNCRLSPECIRVPGWAERTRQRIAVLGVMHKDVAAAAGCHPSLLSSMLAERGRGSVYIRAIDNALDALESAGTTADRMITRAG